MLVIIAVEPLSVRVVHGWMRASTPVGPTPSGRPASTRGSVV